MKLVAESPNSKPRDFSSFLVLSLVATTLEVVSSKYSLSFMDAAPRVREGIFMV
jgi:hypothetical protein